MANFWLMKTEPSTYSYEDLVKEKRTAWTGVANPYALKNIAAMKKGDLTFIYHTGDEKSVVGIAEVVSDPYPDPKAKDPRTVVVDVAPREKLQKPVSLAAIKADKRFADFLLVRVGRLSVMPVSKEQWTAIVKMGGGK